MHKCAYVFSFYNLLEVTHDIHVEDVYWQVVLHTHCRSCDIHHLKALGYHVSVSDVVKLRGSRVFLRVGGIDTIYARTF